MPTWTDDDGVTHAAKTLITTCGHVVASNGAPCRFDEPSRMLTCFSCLVGGGQIGELLEHLEKLEALSKLTDAIDDPHSFKKRLDWVISVANGTAS